MPLLGAYSVSKAALCSMVRSLAFELGPSGIRVNAVCPGVVKTKFSGALIEMEDEIAHQVSVKQASSYETETQLVTFQSLH